jgi:hypothetical protein
MTTRRSIAFFAAVVLVLAALVFWALYSVIEHGELTW